MGNTYYIDSLTRRVDASGLSPESAVASWRSLNIQSAVSCCLGAAVYSIVSSEAELQFTFEGNKYEKAAGLLVRWNGTNYQAEDPNTPLR